jgi:hypothetical protein
MPNLMDHPTKLTVSVRFAINHDAAASYGRMLIRNMCWFRFFVMNSLDFVNSIILSYHMSWKLCTNYAGNLTNFGCEYIWLALWVLNDDCLFHLADKNTWLVLLLMPVITHAPGTSMTLMSGFTCGSLTPRTSKVLKSPLYVT